MTEQSVGALNASRTTYFPILLLSLFQKLQLNATFTLYSISTTNIANDKKKKRQDRTYNMPPPIYSLPNEVLLMISQNLKNADLVSLSLSAKTFSPMAQHTLYESMKITKALNKVSHRARIVNHGRNRVYWEIERAVWSGRLRRLLYISYEKRLIKIVHSRIEWYTWHKAPFLQVLKTLLAQPGLWSKVKSVSFNCQSTGSEKCSTISHDLNDGIEEAGNNLIKKVTTTSNGL